MCDFSIRVSTPVRFLNPHFNTCADSQSVFHHMCRFPIRVSSHVQIPKPCFCRCAIRVAAQLGVKWHTFRYICAPILVLAHIFEDLHTFLRICTHFLQFTHNFPNLHIFWQFYTATRLPIPQKVLLFHTPADRLKRFRTPL